MDVVNVRMAFCHGWFVLEQLRSSCRGAFSCQSLAVNRLNPTTVVPAKAGIQCLTVCIANFYRIIRCPDVVLFWNRLD